MKYLAHSIKGFVCYLWLVLCHRGHEAVKDEKVIEVYRDTHLSLDLLETDHKVYYYLCTRVQDTTLSAASCGIVTKALLYTDVVSVFSELHSWVYNVLKALHIAAALIQLLCYKYINCYFHKEQQYFNNWLNMSVSIATKQHPNIVLVCDYMKQPCDRGADASSLDQLVSFYLLVFSCPLR